MDDAVHRTLVEAAEPRSNTVISSRMYRGITAATNNPPARSTLRASRAARSRSASSPGRRGRQELDQRAGVQLLLDLAVIR